MPAARLRWVGLFVLLLALAVAAAPVLAATESPANSASAAGEVGREPLPSPEVFANALGQAEREDERQEEALEEELASPNAQRERAASRAAYADISGAAAQSLLTNAFPEALQELNADPARALSRLEIEKTLGAYAARVSNEEGGSELVESSIPIEVGHGAEKAPVDLSLERSGAGFVPRNPLSDVQLPASAAGEVRLPDGVALANLPGEGDPSAHRFGEESLFYPNTDAATDTLIAPKAHGVEIFEQLRSPESPEQLRYPLSLPDGASLQADNQGGAEVLGAGGEVLATVPAPAAVDAQGSPVATSLSVDGDSLLIEVDHRSADLAYPILLDPALEEENAGPGAPSSGSWNPVSEGGGSYFLEHSAGSLHVRANKGNFFPAASFGQYVFAAPGTTAFIRRAMWNPIFGVLPSVCVNEAEPHGYVGIFNVETNQYEPQRIYSPISEANGSSFDTGSVGTSHVRVATVGVGQNFFFGSTISCDHEIFVGGVTLFFEDPEAPSVGAVTGPGGPVASAPAQIKVSASDPGFGVSLIRVTAKGSDGQTKTWSASPQPGCNGLRESECPHSVIAQPVSIEPSLLPEGNDTLTITALDPAGHVSAPKSLTVTVDRTAPDTVIDTGPANNGAIAGTTASFTYHSTEASSTFQCKVDAGSFASCPSSGFTTPTLADGEHTFSVRATDQIGNQDASPATRTFFSGPPDTIIDSGPTGEIAGKSAKFTFHATQPNAKFTCTISAVPFTCAGSVSASALEEGSHLLVVTAISSAGVPDPTPATRAFRTDPQPPETTITSGPEGPTNNPTPTFTYTSNDPKNAHFECELDGASFQGCAAQGFEPPAPLPDGPHSFFVRAVDQVGNIGGARRRDFTVNTGPPSVQIESGPSGPTNNPTPTFTFAASGGAVSCSIEAEGSTLEEPSFSACSSSSSDTPSTPLADGSYIFIVRATDATGNEASDARSFTVDTASPDTTISSGPSGTTDDSKPTFAFFSSERGSSFRCRFDSEAFRSCSGPGGTETPVAALSDGPHTFEVRATDAAGNTDPTPAVAAFVVQTSGPQTQIDSGPRGATTETGPTFKYSADEPSSFECKLDAAGFAPCPTGSDVLSGLSEGEHRFEVRAKNGAGIVDPTPATRSFIVDTSPPSLPVLSGPVREAGVPGLSLHLEVKDGDPSSPQSIRSGVGAIRITIDGKFSETLNARCSLNVCPAAAVREFQLPAAQVIGTRHYTVEAEDGVGYFSPLASWDKTTPEAGTLYLAKAKGQSDCLAHAKPLDKEHSKPVGGVLRGTNGSDRIIAGHGVKTIYGEGGCDLILAGSGQEIIKGGDGNDLIRAERSNDTVLGGKGDDQIYGGIGDDQLRGGPDNDLIDGGPGADTEKGEAGNDTLRGGQGEDKLSGGAETDTLSYADAVSPGFTGNGGVSEYSGWPGVEPGVHINLNTATVEDGSVGAGGGTDRLIGKGNGSFEHIAGSPFADLIERPSGAQQVDGGPGPDVIRGGGAENVTRAEADFLEGDPPRTLGVRPAGKIELGFQSGGDQGLERNLFLAGSAGNDGVKVRYFKQDNKVQFVAESTTIAESFLVSGCKPRPPTQHTVNCPLGAAKLGAVDLFGGGGEDKLTIETESREAPGAFVLDGGAGGDVLNGGELEELLVDGEEQGPGKVEQLRGGPGDDAILQGLGADEIQGDGGNDLLISSHICEGDEIFGDGGESKGKPQPKDTGSDDAQFHPLKGVGVFADLEEGKLGEVESSNTCPGEGKETLSNVNDLEGSDHPDFFKGTKNSNLLIGRGGADKLLSGEGIDKIDAKDGAIDANVNCGGQKGDEVHYDPDVQGKSENKVGVIHHCEIESPAGRSFPHRPSFGNEEESEPPVLGAVVEPASPRPNIAAYFPLDDTAGTTAANLIKEDANGTYEAAGVGPSVNGPGPTLGVAGALGGEEEEEAGEDDEDGSAVKLNGTNNYVDLSGQGGPGETEAGPYSVELFVKFARPPGEKEYLFSSSEGGEGVFLYRDPGGKIVFSTGTEAGAPQVSSAEAIKDEGWHLVVGTLEGKTINLNVDGFPYRLGYGESVLPKEAKSPQGLIGAGPGLTGFLAATVDEFASFEGALSEAEIFAQLAESRAEEPELLLTPPAETSDVDGDGIPDGADNCPEVSNSDQADVDMNGIGDACEPPDADGDGVADATDNCPSAYNPEQSDGNGDGIGDECAQLPPTVSAEAATSVKGASATLHAAVNSGGLATTYQFEYGTTTAYGTKVPLSPESIGSGSSVVTLNKAIASLSPNTTYHYRVVANNQAGETEGADETFTTLKLPVATTEAATAPSATAATLHAMVNPEGSPTTYQFEYGTTTAYGSSAPASPKSIGSGTAPVPVSEALSGLKPNTTYHYRVVAGGEGGTVNGEDKQLTTTAPGGLAEQLATMAVTEPFNGTFASLTNFEELWEALAWVSFTPRSGVLEKGGDSTSGWQPSRAFPAVNGAFYMPTVTDPGHGSAAVATMAASPGGEGRYFSLWLDMPDPANAQTGYELRFTSVAANTFNISLFEWQEETQTLLASKSGVALANGSSLAIVDQGGAVSAWTAGSGAEFTQLFSAADSTFGSGFTGIEASGSLTRLTNFKGGPLAPF